MNYECKLENGRHLEIGNEGEQTFVRLISLAQHQGSSFSTGKWSKAPTAFQIGTTVIVGVETGQGARYLEVVENQIRSLDREPDPENATPIELTESKKPSGWKTMERMKPMEPMKPMQSMKEIRADD